MKEWLNKQKFIIFGAGILGTEIFNILEHYKSIICFIDNNVYKQNQGYMGYSILSFEQYLKEYRTYKIILACSKENKAIIENQMIKSGLNKNRDFCYIDYFKINILHQYILKNYNQCFMNQ